MDDAQLKDMGRRLRESARAAGYSSERIAQALGNTSGAVRAWWVGRNQIPLDLLVPYARLVGRSLTYLITGQAAEQDPVPLPVEQWAKLFPEDQEALRVQLRTWALLRDLAAGRATEPTTDE